MRTIFVKFVPSVLIFVTDYLTSIGIKTVLDPPYNPEVAPRDFCLFPKLKEKLRGYRYETILQPAHKRLETYRMHLVGISYLFLALNFVIFLFVEIFIDIVCCE